MWRVDIESVPLEKARGVSDWGRGEVVVQFSGIRGPTAVAVDRLRVRAPERIGHNQSVFLLEIEWPEMVDISDVVYFLWIVDSFGRQYDVFRQLQRQGRRIVVEAGQKS